AKRRVVWSNSSCQRDEDQRLAHGISFTRQPDCDHMLRKSCSRTACHKRCPTHPPLPASSHPPDPSPASTATRRRPPDSAPPSHRSRHAALPVRWRPAKPVRDCQDLSPPQPTLPSACGAARSYCRENCLHLRGDVEQTIIKQHGRGFRSQCNFCKTVLNQCDLFRRHCNSPRARI